MKILTKAQILLLHRELLHAFGGRDGVCVTTDF